MLVSSSKSGDFAQRGNNFSSQDKKFAFMFDFEKKVDELLELNLNPNLIDNWESIEHLLEKRKSIKFLKSYNKIINDADLLKHVHNGDFHIKMRGGNATIGEPKITGSHNLLSLRNPPPPLLPGEMSWKIPPPISYSNPSDVSNSYRKGKIERNMNDLIDPHTGLGFVNGSGSSLATKKGENVYFPSSYNTKRINEEMSYAHSLINRQNPDKIDINSIGQTSFTYYSKATDGHTIEIVYLSNNSNPLSATLQTIYPQIF